jgi:hypothetical protein
MTLNGKEVVVTLFVLEGKVRTAFVPTHHAYPQDIGYSHNHAKWYIKSQQMVKKHVPGEEITPGVNKGEQSSHPGPEPDPAKN